jgi:hypothetical protein
MSIKNERTGRHEDDLYAEFLADGSVSLQSLIDHLNECVVEQPAAFSVNVRTPVKMATLVLEQLKQLGVLDAGERVSL